MAEHILKRHNKNLLIYHIVCPAKFRRKIFTEGVEQTLKQVCLELGICYEIRFLEIGVDEDHVHFLIQSIPNKCVSDMVKLIKSITAKELFKAHPEVKNMLWKGNLWTMGYYVNTVGQYGNLKMLENYVRNQGIPSYTQLHSQSPTLFDEIL
jgi:REP element-mobilizing transposase RayT